MDRELSNVTARESCLLLTTDSRTAGILVLTDCGWITMTELLQLCRIASDTLPSPTRDIIDLSRVHRKSIWKHDACSFRGLLRACIALPLVICC